MADTPQIDVLTAQEVASILQVSRNTVYGLARAGTLPSYNVGRKLRFSLEDVQTYIDASRSARQRPAPAPLDTRAAPSGSTQPPARARRAVGRNGDPIASGAYIIGGRDVALDLLANYLSAAGIRALRSYQSGYQELVELYLGRVHAASVHLWDGASDSYNLPYVKRLVPGTPVVVLHLATRSQGLLVKRRNPLGLSKWSDLVRRPVVLANREKGSGSRVLLDEHLRLLEADPYAIEGYEREVVSELAQGTLIARGGADVGVGTRRVSDQLRGLDFRPLQTERLALVIAKTPATERFIRMVRGLLASELFAGELAALSGHDFAQMGHRLYET
ncbi:MAG TPA: helix-turn-helix transcriptional regulator [Thermoleophilia bacterium]|nr:helix-turn-helix transcriptional regulator [Thermoleophilia bacterium]